MTSDTSVRFPDRHTSDFKILIVLWKKTFKPSPLNVTSYHITKPDYSTLVMILIFQLFLLAVLMTYLSFENVSLGKTSQSQVTLSSVGNTKIGKTCHMLGFPLRLERGSCVGWKSWVLERMSDFWSRILFHCGPVVEGASGQGRLEVRILWMSQIKRLIKKCWKKLY